MLNCKEALSNFAFEMNLRRSTLGTAIADQALDLALVVPNRLKVAW
jgi:hypothetical protein